jgi:hypothetical protein
MKYLLTQLFNRFVAIFFLLAFSVAMPLLFADHTVMFNVSNHKYHGLQCQWAKKCTKNCIKILYSQAQKKGGIPCQVCHGS